MGFGNRSIMTSNSLPTIIQGGIKTIPPVASQKAGNPGIKGRVNVF